MIQSAFGLEHSPVERYLCESRTVILMNLLVTFPDAHLGMLVRGCLEVLEEGGTASDTDSVRSQKTLSLDLAGDRLVESVLELRVRHIARSKLSSQLWFKISEGTTTNQP